MHENYNDLKKTKSDLVSIMH